MGDWSSNSVFLHQDARGLECFGSWYKERKLYSVHRRHPVRRCYSTFTSCKMQALMYSYLVALCSFFTLSALAAPTGAPCNQQLSFCDRKYSNVTFVGTHDSPFVGPLPTQNQDKSVTDQLNAGVRFLQAQTHNFLNTPFMCHTSCFEENAGTVQAYLTQVKNWLDANPNDVVTMLWTNPDKIAMTKFDAVFKTVGATRYVFKPSSSPNPLPMGSWPTLGQMIASGQRLVVFIGKHVH